MNVEKTKDGDKFQLHFFEGFWSDNKDMLNNPYPKQTHHSAEWNGAVLFSRKLLKLQQSLISQLEFVKIPKLSCKLCKQKDIGDKEYVLKRRHWRDDLIHNIIYHNYIPNVDFIEFILGHYVGIVSDNRIRLPTLLYGNNDHVKIDRNQLQILDSLMKNGGYTKKYTDSKGTLKYSEHAGLLIFDDNELDKIIISGDSVRTNEQDPEILLPSTLKEALDCEYIFHTHPPTPYPGSRVKNGVLFELPSPSDITHFIEHSVIGITKGSLIITPEGLYNIRINNPKQPKYMFKDRKELKRLKKQMQDIETKIQRKYIRHTKTSFYEIAKNKAFLKPLNDFLEKYNIHIDFYPRVKNTNGEWVLDRVYLKK